MNQPAEKSRSSVLYYRLISLWVLSEAMLGGIIHGLRIPVSGLLVGSCAVICIALIAWFFPAKGAILKATLIVAIFKMMLSPQAPLPAYFAVFFQGFLGELLFHRRRFFPAACILLAILALLESGLQRILVLTIIYGNGLWHVVNDFFNKLTGQRELTDYSFFIIICYVLLHLLAGILVGVWAGSLPQRVKLLAGLKAEYPLVLDDGTKPGIIVRRKRKKFRVLMMAIWMLFLLLYLQSVFHVGKPWLPASLALQILVRSVLIILGWVFIAGPLLKQLLHRWLQKKQTQSRNDVRQVLALLPLTQSLVAGAWRVAGIKKGWARVRLSARIILAHTFTRDDVNS